MLGFHKCSEEELGLTGTNSSFFPVNENQMEELRAYAKNMMCLDDPSLIEIRGDYNSVTAKALEIKL